MKEQDKFILDIKRLGINGEGIGFYKKLAVFVDNAIPGEGHNVCVTKVLNKMAFAETFEIKHSSPDRIDITCPYYKECGGCNVSHIKYNRMLELKRSLIIETLNRYTAIKPRSFEIKQTVRSNDIYNYRNRSLVSVKKIGEGYTTCLVNPKTNELVSVDSCLLQNNIINDLNNKNRKSISQVVLMVQYEVAKRLSANEKSPSKEFGLLSILAQFWANVEYIRKVPSRSFFPAPKVDSAIVKLTVNNEPLLKLSNYDFFKKVIKGCFATRRKNIKNSLINVGFAKNAVEKTLADLNINENLRGEALSISQMGDLSEKLKENLL